jgi:tetratricopeptide (TPR) repeat protein
MSLNLVEKIKSLKENGNNLLKNKENEKAIEVYSEGIEIILDKQTEINNYEELLSIFFSNRSCSYSNIKEYKKALNDAKLSIKHNPIWSKVFLKN